MTPTSSPSPPGRPQARPSHARRAIADALEALFGPDPGLLRLRMASRVLISGLISLGVVLLLFGSEGMKAAPEVALGFMLSMFANMAVRDPSPRAQAITLALLIVPALAAITIASLLAPWRWASDLVFLLIVSGAPLAQGAGPRWMAFTMVGFIAYFLGQFLHPSLATIPSIAAAGAIALASTALTRFLLLRDRPDQALRRVRRHIDRRLIRLLDEVDGLLDAAAGGQRHEDGLSHRLHREIARLNDAFSIAQDQLDARESGAGGLSWDHFFALELAAERLVRVAAAREDEAGRATAHARIRTIRQALAAERGPPPATDGSAGEGMLGRALDRFQQALAEITREPARTA